MIFQVSYLQVPVKNNDLLKRHEVEQKACQVTHERLFLSRTSSPGIAVNIPSLVHFNCLSQKKVSPE